MRLGRGARMPGNDAEDVLGELGMAERIPELEAAGVLLRSGPPQ
jgi:hypothetical protein